MHTQREGLARRGLLLIFAGCLASTVQAGDWNLDESYSLSTSVVQRENDSGRNDYDSLALRATPRLRLHGESGRARADISYGLSGLLDSDSGNSASGLSHSLNGTASTELIKRRFFLRGSAFAGLTNSTNTSAPVNNFSRDNESIQTYALTLMPEFRHHLGRKADFVSRNSIRYFGSDGTNNNDNISTRLQAGLQSGPYYGPVSWSLGAFNTNTSYDNSSSSVTSLDADLGYRVNRIWRVFSGLGFSEGDTLNGQRNSGLNWSLGTSWTPSPRTSLSGRFGQNYSGNVWNGQFSHRSRRARFALGLSRSLTDTTTVLLQEQEFNLLNPDGSQALDPLTGDPLVGTAYNLVPNADNFINTTATASLTLSGRRSSIGGTATYSDRDYDLANRDEEYYSFRVNSRRSLTPKTGVNLNLGVSHLSGNTQDNTTYDVIIGATTRLGRYSSLGLNVGHRVFESSLPNNGYTEESVTLTFRSKFL